MRELFRELLQVQDVRGVSLFSAGGTVLFQEWRVDPPRPDRRAEVFSLLTAVLAGHKEADVAFRHGRLYARETPAGLLLVVTGLGVPLALVRLQLDLLLPSLLPRPQKRGFLGLFGGAS